MGHVSLLDDKGEMKMEEKKQRLGRVQRRYLEALKRGPMTTSELVSMVGSKNSRNGLYYLQKRGLVTSEQVKTEDRGGRARVWRLVDGVEDMSEEELDEVQE